MCKGCNDLTEVLYGSVPFALDSVLDSVAEETQRIKQAQESRLGHRTWRARINSFSTLLGMVVIRSFDRAEGVYEAMTLRGHNGTIVGTAKLTNSDLSGLVVVVPLIVLLLWIGYTI